MITFIENIALYPVVNNINVYQCIFALIFPAILTIPVYQTYKKINMGSNFSQEFKYTLFLFSTLASASSIIISGNLTRAIGFLGVFSIIKFRTAIKSSKDLVFLLWVLVLGLSVGTSYIILSIMILIVGVIVMLSVSCLSQRNKNNRGQFDILIHSSFDDTTKEIEKYLKSNFKSYSKVHVFINNLEELNVIYDLNYSNYKSILDLDEKIKAMSNVKQVKCIKLSSM